MALCICCSVAARFSNEEVCVLLSRGNDNSGFVDTVALDTTRGVYAHTFIPQLYPLSNFQVFSPDKNLVITYEAADDKNDLYNFYVQGADESSEKRLLQAGVWIQSGNIVPMADQIRWSHDSSQIGLLWYDAQQILNLTLASADGSQSKSIKPFGDSFTKHGDVRLQEWSADDQYVSVITGQPYSTSYTFWDTRTLTHVPYDLENVPLIRGTWSPQGHQFAALFQDENLLWSNLALITPNANLLKTNSGQSSIQHVMWSPDGQAVMLAYFIHSCNQPTCPSLWHYALYKSADLSLAADLAGVKQGAQNVYRGTMYGSDGRTTFSGYQLNAIWSPDSGRFAYLYQHAIGSRDVFDLQAFDWPTDQTITLAADVIPFFKSQVFHTNDNTYFGSRIPEDIPTYPISDVLIVPHEQDDTLVVEQGDIRWQNPITLVSGANQIERLPTDYMTGQFWTPNWPIPNYILILWSTGFSTEKNFHLTISDDEHSNVKTLDLGFDNVSRMQYLGTDDHPLLGFIGTRGTQSSLYLLSLKDSKLNVLLDNLDATDRWSMSLSPQGNRVAFSINTNPILRNPVYLMSVTGGAPVTVPANLSPWSLWSPDEQKVAITDSTSSKQERVRIVRTDGTIINQTILKEHLKDYGLWRWTNCASSATG